jgi:hypothetical protein
MGTNQKLTSQSMILLMVITGLGFLIKYILLTGSDSKAIYGRDLKLFFLVFDRHKWGNIHFYLGFGFLFFMFLHIIFHWKIITSIFKKMVQGKNIRRLIVTSIGFVALFFALSLFLLMPEITL